MPRKNGTMPPEILYSTASGDIQEEWGRVQAIVSKYEGRWTAPPTDVVTENMTSGPILGNGDIGVVLGGDEDMQTYYISKSDFWAMIREAHSDGTPKAIGGLSIRNQSASNGHADYNVVQDILNAEVRSELRFHGSPLRTKAWVAPNTNELVIELAPMDEKEEVNIQAELWSKAENSTADNSTADNSAADNSTVDNSAAGYQTGAGIDGNNIWITRRTPVRALGAGYAAVAVHVFGGEKIEVDTDGSGISILRFTIPVGQKAYIVATVDGGKEKSNCLEAVKERIAALQEPQLEELYAELQKWWQDYWLKEYVVLNDEGLEEYYYGSLYQMGATSREGKMAPGLFGHWTTTDNPAWGGDYTLDYNYYGPFNGMASANRLEQFASYFRPILDYMEEGKKNARVVKSVHGKLYPDGLPGVKYPTHIGPWGMETYFDCGMKSHAVFAALPFCWYYNYSQDRGFLRNIAYPYLLEVAGFWEEYLQKDADGRYVVYESSARESWSGSNDTNPIIDLAFIRNLFTNLIQMSMALGEEEGRREKWQDILEHLSPLPTMEFDGKTVFRESENRQEISTEGIGDNPVNLQGIFPGDNIGLESEEELLKIAKDSLETMNSWNQGNAFANIFVMGARVGWPAEDLLHRMKARISSIKKPNLTYQSDGHGIEGAGAIEAINTMLLQSHEHVLRFFPVWPKNRDAEFVRMRADGAFLVSAKLESGIVRPITLYSEKGGRCRLENPWPNASFSVRMGEEKIEVIPDGKYFTFETEAGTEYRIYLEEK